MRFYSKLEDEGNFWVVYMENGPKFPLDGLSLRNVNGMNDEVGRLVNWLNENVAVIAMTAQEPATNTPLS